MSNDTTSSPPPGEEDAQTAALQAYFDDNRPAGYGASFRAGWDAGRSWQRAEIERLTALHRSAEQWSARWKQGAQHYRVLYSEAVDRGCHDRDFWRGRTFAVEREGAEHRRAMQTEINGLREQLAASEGTLNRIRADLTLSHDDDVADAVHRLLLMAAGDAAGWRAACEANQADFKTRMAAAEGRAARLGEIRAAHVPMAHQPDVCAACNQMLPCDALGLLAEIERLTALAQAAERSRPEPPRCLDCRASVAICDHAVRRILEPERSYWLGIQEELTARLAASEGRAARLEAIETAARAFVASIDALDWWQSGPTREQQDKQIAAMTDLRAALTPDRADDEGGKNGV